ncbi:NUDIX domain-containing protein [Micromonospora robiginosa]|uniref:NUDIX hydrolase n=1 Tax=Micromonospora robiginosa TaxID=2749844 RepID=A0A7L6B8X1_9ACTN|nr:NUDIX hydrolase [Micromonospora ferruginea]QLQ38384.1 NUDIX hydrolase [Micromonospora ferruginea]
MADERPLYERDPAAWQAHLAEGNARQPRKRVGADVLLRNRRGEILLVNPRYKPDWDLPGGMAEANEPPHVTAAREFREELGLELRVGSMLVVDWVAPHGPWDDSLMFVFDGGVLPGTAHLRPTDGELAEARFVALDDARALLRPYIWQRLRHAVGALADGRPRYLVGGA